MSRPRSVWRCDKCNAYHIGGLDIRAEGDDIVAVCGTRWSGEDESADCDMYEENLTVIDGEGFEGEWGCNDPVTTTPNP